MRKVPWVGVMLAATMASCMTWSDALTQPSFELGLKLGAGFAKLTGSELETSDPGPFDLGGGFTGVGTLTSGLKDTNTGFLAGGYAAMHVNPRFGIRLEALYAMKGGKGDTAGMMDVYDPSNAYVGTLSITGSTDLSLDYVEFPLLGVVSFPAGTNSTFEIFAGPAFAFQTGAEVKEEVTAGFQGQFDTQSQTIDLGDQFKGNDVGGVLGAGMSFQVGTRRLFLDARWTAGFTEIDNSGSGLDWKNSVLSISGGIGFLLGTKR